MNKPYYDLGILETYSATIQDVLMQFINQHDEKMGKDNLMTTTLQKYGVLVVEDAQKKPPAPKLNHAFKTLLNQLGLSNVHFTPYPSFMWNKEDNVVVDVTCSDEINEKQSRTYSVFTKKLLEGQSVIDLIQSMQDVHIVFLINPQGGLFHGGALRIATIEKNIEELKKPDSTLIKNNKDNG